MALVPIKQDDKNKYHTAPCVFCKSPAMDEINFGPMYESENIVVHYYCMIFSSGLSQHGHDGEGILGFMPNDILKEVRRGDRLKCTFCQVKGASIGCGKSRCKFSYHFPCGLENEIQYQFVDKFESFCPSHYVPQIIPVAEGEEALNCPICREDIMEDEEKLMALCCKGAVFHKMCLKRMALNAGYFFKCPMCNNAGKPFVREMRIRGIFVPEMDASWEQEPNAFSELYFEYANCDSHKCSCPHGRTFDETTGEYALARCSVCGSKGIHKKCGKLKKDEIDKWSCSNCLEVVKKAELDLTMSKPLRTNLPNVPISSSCSKELVDISLIKFSERAAAYFPYTQEQLDILQLKACQMLPDWRGYYLRVNLVDWLGHYMKTRGVSMGNGITRDMLPPPENLHRRSQVGDTATPSNRSSTYVNGERRLQKSKPNHKKKRSSRWKRGFFGKDRKRLPKRETKTNLSSELPLVTVTSVDTYMEETENMIANSEDGLISSYTPPVKKRKIIELGHNIYADGIKRDLYVQENVEIKDFHSLKAGPPEFHNGDIAAIIQLQQQENEKPTSEVVEENMLVEAAGKENLEMNGGQIDISYGDIWFEHSYAKFSKTPSNLTELEVRTPMKKSMECGSHG